MAEPPRQRIMLGVTAAVSLGLMKGFPTYLAEEGWEVHVVSAPRRPDDAMVESGEVRWHDVPMKRDPSPFNDLVSLLRWVRVIAATRPDVVMTGTPKAGLLGMIASRIVGIPTRIYLLRGLRYETENGLKRSVLRVLEQLTAALSTHVIAVSASLRNVALSDGVAPAERILVLGDGSSNGVDLTIFNRGNFSTSQRMEIRDQLSIPRDSRVALFVGRVSKDKGSAWLARLAMHLSAEASDKYLLVVGEDERDGTSDDLESHSRLRRVGKVKDVARYMNAADLLVLPTKREGFPNVVLEAAAMGIPAVSTNVTGACDAVVSGVTGVLVEPDDPEEFCGVVSSLLEDEEALGRMGDESHERARSLFSRVDVWARYTEFLNAASAKTSAHG